MSDKKEKEKIAHGSTLFKQNLLNVDVKARIAKNRIEQNKKLKKGNFKSPNSELFQIHNIPDPENVDRIFKLLNSKGILVKDYKATYIIRRLRSRVTRTNSVTYLKYYDYLKDNPKEIDQLKKSLSINVTRFFRNRDTFDEIKKKVVPDLIKNGTSKQIRAWSAGCAVGAEAYSMSIIMRDISSFSIMATDIKQELLDLGIAAKYHKDYLAEMRSEEIARYFDMTLDEIAIVKRKIKSKVNFSLLDLLRDKYPTNLDLILCRNVLIYINKEAQAKIIKGFVDSLNPGGFLVLGRTESIFQINNYDVLESYDSKHRIYKKMLS